jgi:Tfp pilus assembly protein PilF
MTRGISVVVLVAALQVRAAPEALRPTAEVMKDLLAIEAVGYHADQVDRVRMDLTAKARAKPAECMPRVYVAWLTLPTDDSWNQLKALAPIFPDNPWVHYGMGRVYVKWKMADQARNELNQVLKRDPKFFPALASLGDLASQRDELPEAEAFYRQALVIAPDDPLALTGLGLVLLKQGKKDQAREALKTSTHAYPEQPAALVALVPLLVDSKDAASVEAAQAVCELRPKDAVARRQLADLKFAAGDLAGAAKEFEKLSRLGGSDAAVLAQLAGIYKTLGNADEEERIEQNLAALEPTSTQHNLRLADLHRAKKDLEGTEAQYLEVLARDPKHVGAQLALARLKTDAGLDYEAVERLRAAKAADPANTEVATQLEALEASFKLGNHQLKGNVNGINWAIIATLDKLFTERKASKPSLAGKIKVRVHISDDGRATAVDVLEDTVKDPLLVGHVYFKFRDAEYYERKKVEPVVEFELGGAKKGK